MVDRSAIMAASVRLDAPSLRRIADTWTLAVLTLMNSRSPICRLVSPSAISVEHLLLPSGELDRASLVTAWRPAERQSGALGERARLRQ